MYASSGRARALVEYCIGRLEHCVTVAKIAAGGDEPEFAALYLVDTIQSLGRELMQLRRFARRAR